MLSTSLSKSFGKPHCEKCPLDVTDPRVREICRLASKQIEYLDTVLGHHGLQYDAAEHLLIRKWLKEAEK